MSTGGTHQRRQRLLRLTLPLALAIVVPPPVAQAAPSGAFTDPRPGTTVVVPASYRPGWTESSSRPILARTFSTYTASASDPADCATRSFSLIATASDANRPLRYPRTRLVAGTCYRWQVRLVDSAGVGVTLVSGIAWVGVASQGDGPALAWRLPALGAMTDEPPGRQTLAWTETVVGAEAPVVDRRLDEESAAASGRSCAGVSWTTGSSVELSGATASVDLADGTCHRWTLTVTDASGGVSTARSGTILATRRPPACLYGDVPTRYRALADRSRTLVDTTYGVGSSYAPSDLVSTYVGGALNGGYLIRDDAKGDLAAMARAAAAAGARLQVVSAFRSYRTQRSTFAYWVSVSGLAAALVSSARPGHSEHQLGTALDFTSSGGAAPWAYADWATTRAGAWIARHGWEYGFVLSYPGGTRATTCYRYEPWHWRWVGRTTARAIHDAGLTPREYLWRSGSTTPGD